MARLKPQEPQSPPPSPDILITDVAWAAGLFDGEGSVGLIFRKSRKYWFLRLSLEMTDQQAVEKFRRVVGIGYLTSRSGATSTGRKLHSWGAQSKQAEVVLRLLFPYLVVKRRQAELGLESRMLIQAQPYGRVDKVELKRIRDAIVAVNHGQTEADRVNARIA